MDRLTHATTTTTPMETTGMAGVGLETCASRALRGKFFSFLLFPYYTNDYLKLIYGPTHSRNDDDDPIGQDRDSTEGLETSTSRAFRGKFLCFLFFITLLMTT